MNPTDHYKILGISRTASNQDVRKAYRGLAHIYHPDKNPNNILAEDRFKEISASYAVLSNTQTRKEYDTQLWKEGLAGYSYSEQEVTPVWLIKICKELNRSLSKMDDNSISQSALQAYILLILSDAHLLLLVVPDEAAIAKQIIEELLIATQKLNYKYLPEIHTRLLKITSGDDILTNTIREASKRKAKAYKQEQLQPYIIILVTILLCVFIYFYGRAK